jgi:hypothetical protein
LSTRPKKAVAEGLTRNPFMAPPTKAEPRQIVRPR